MKQNEWRVNKVIFHNVKSILEIQFIMNNKIVSYDRAGRLDEAVFKLEAKIKEDPKSEKAQYLLGYTCSQLYNNKDIFY